MLAAVSAALLLSSCSARDEPAKTATASGAASVPASGATTQGDVSGLAATSWRLVEFQSMDDAQGVTRVDDPSRYTLDLHADGTAALRLDCNRASGTWSARASADGSNGSFEFGPLAMTRASCPPPDIGEQIARQAEYIRGYLLRDGRLYLSLMADGGIYVWEARPEATAF